MGRPEQGNEDGGKRFEADAGRAAAESDQATSDSDQSTADADQTAADADQTTSDRDQAAANLDQRASDRDQAQADLDRDEMPGAESTDAFERSRSERAHAMLDRRATRHLRSQIASERDEQAARDREAAALDREHLLAEIEHAHIDALTGAYRRGLGETVLGHELERARRTPHGLVGVFLDIDGLKDWNDSAGHDAGDRLLRDVAAAVQSHLRPYDPLVRWGGDEFVCTISNADRELAGRRIEEIRATLHDSQPHARVSVGLAELRPDDDLGELLKRADVALLATRRSHSAE